MSGYEHAMSLISFSAWSLTDQSFFGSRDANRSCITFGVYIFAFPGIWRGLLDVRCVGLCFCALINCCRISYYDYYISALLND